MLIACSFLHTWLWEGSLFRGKWHFGVSGELSGENGLSGEGEEWEGGKRGRDTRTIKGEVETDKQLEEGEREH